LKNKLSLPELLSRELKSRSVTISTGADPQIISATGISHIGHLGLAVSSNTAIRHNSIVEVSPIQTSSFKVGSGQIGSFQTGSLEIGSGQVASREVGFTQISASQGSVDELSLSKIGSTQTGVIDRGSSQISSSEVGTFQINLPHAAVSKLSSTQIGFSQVGLPEISIAQVDVGQISTAHISQEQVEPREVSFPGSVTPQQFFLSNRPLHENLIQTAHSIVPQDPIVLSEARDQMSRLSQTFIVPTGAKYIQFTLDDVNLSASALAPPDAFEVALLNAQTNTPVAGVASGLSQPDSLLNLQANGQTYFGSRASVPGTASGLCN
jgi:hypothetical protein